MSGFFQLCVVDFKRTIVPRLQGSDTGLVNVKANNAALFSEFYSQRQTYVTEANHSEFDFFQLNH